MTRCTRRWPWAALTSIACLAFGASLFAVTRPALRAAAAPAGAPVAISFDDFHGYAATEDYLQKVAAANPAITELVEIGRTAMDRPIHVLVISNMKTGVTLDRLVPLRNPRKNAVANVTPMKPYQGKPGVWIDGGTHGNEFTGTEVCLYTIDKLISNYQRDPGITRLVDDATFYICPMVNPDGVYNSVDRGISQRQNSVREDDDHDGKVNEDGPDDLNGDGLITQFRYKDPGGRYYISEADPRVMVRLGQNETTTRERYSVVVEDKDNDGDGRRGEDFERGIDVNRNFPEGWYRDDSSQGGSGTYPSSSAEAHAVLEYFTNHTNILLVQSFHTSGGFTYRPFARWPDSRMDPRDLAVFDGVMGKKYLELVGEAKPAATGPPPASDGTEATAERAGLADQQRPGQVRRPAAPGAGGQQPPTAGQAAPAGAWRHPYNEANRTPYGYGVFLDWAYGQFGAWAMSTELWNWQRDTKGLAGYAGENDRVKWETAYIAYQDKALGGRAFVPWTPFKHPELGDGEIGGWVARYGAGNAIPGESLRAVCETHWQFERYKATLLPRLEVKDAKATVLYSTDHAGDVTAVAEGDTLNVRRTGGKGRYRVVQVTATITNTGPLPTHVTRGASLRGNRDDVVWLIGDRDKVVFLQGTPWLRLGTLDGTLALPAARGGGVPAGRGGGGGGRGAPVGMPGVPAELREQRPDAPAAETGATRHVAWLVAIEGDSPLKLVLSSQKGGTVATDLRVQ